MGKIDNYPAKKCLPPKWISRSTRGRQEKRFPYLIHRENYKTEGERDRYDRVKFKVKQKQKSGQQE
jgi:hypothetical protein